MKSNNMMIGLIIFLIMASVFLTLADWTHRAQADTDPALYQKLDEVLNYVRSINGKLDEIKNDLYVIRIRVSQNQ